MNKKTFFIILSGILVSAAYPACCIFAQLQPYAPGAPQVGSVNTLVDSIESLVWMVFAGIVVVCFVMAGILFLTAQGQPEKLQAARSAFIWGVAGVIVGIVAYSIIALVSDALFGGNFLNIHIGPGGVNVNGGVNVGGVQVNGGVNSNGQVNGSVNGGF